MKDYGDDVAEAAFDVIRKITDKEFCPDAIEGVAKTIEGLKASGKTIDDAKVIGTKIFDGLNDVAKSETVFKALKAFKDPDAFKGVGKLVDVADEGAPRLHSFIEKVTDPTKLLEGSFKNVAEFSDDGIKSFGRLIKDFEPGIAGGLANEMDDLALTMTNNIYKDFREKLVTNVDFLRDSNGNLIKGIITQPDGKGASSLITQIVPDRPGALGFALEPVGTKNVIGVEFSKDEIVQMGKRFEVTSQGIATTIEADVLVSKNGLTLFIDIKRFTGKYTERSIRGIEDALARGLIDEAIFGAENMIVPKYAKKLIDEANKRLLDANLPLIRIINVGSFK